MIIVTENKKNHYMIKNFLIDFKSYQNINESSNDKTHKFHKAFNDMPGQDNPVGFYPKVKDKENEIITDKDITRIATDEEIEFVANKNKKYKKFLNKFINTAKVLPFMAAVLLYNSTHIGSPQHYKAVELINDANENVQEEVDFNEKKLSLTKNEKDIFIAIKNNQYAFDGVTQQNETSLYNFEGFASEPYKDAGGMSIGYGTQLFSKWKNPNNSGWQKVFFENILGNQKTNNPKTVIRNDIETKLSDITSITKNEARKAINKILKNRIKSLDSYILELPGTVQLAYLDMTINMGENFNMPKFKSQLKYTSDLIKEGEFEVAIQALSASMNQAEFKVDPNYLSIMHSDDESYDPSKEIYRSAWATQSKKAYLASSEEGEIHRRPRFLLSLMQEGVDLLRSKLNTKKENTKKDVNESYSIKRLYKHLFV
jgi:hypothetical protein